MPALLYNISNAPGWRLSVMRCFTILSFVPKVLIKDLRRSVKMSVYINVADSLLWLGKCLMILSELIVCFIYWLCADVSARWKTWFHAKVHHKGLDKVVSILPSIFGILLSWNTMFAPYLSFTHYLLAANLTHNLKFANISCILLCITLSMIAISLFTFEPVPMVNCICWSTMEISAWMTLGQNDCH